ncbi:Lrp/AsnC family transcriptional regulator [Candidatus Woesearchaeota archaeon]|nr:Lrp/AsnC family transcriptional regulator [Candidatus Woesearchaeota archaeon]
MEKKYRLTPTEQSVIRQLEKNSRYPFSKIGKRSRMSQQRVSYTVESLIRKKIIERFYALIDYSKFDVLHFRVYFKVSYTNEQDFKELVRYLKDDPSTSWVSGCGGRYDLICTFFAMNPSSFNKALKGILREFPNQLDNYTILTSIVLIHFGRKYLFSSSAPTPPQEIIGGDRKPELIQAIDLEILSLIAENARMAAVEIGNKLGLTAKTVIKRINDLVERKIIRGFRPSLDISKTEKSAFIIAIKTHNVIPEIEDKLVDYLRVHPNVVAVVKTLGEWDLEIQIEVSALQIYRKIELEIRQRFKSLIRSIERIPLYGESYKLNFFPGFLLGQKNQKNIR